MNKQNEQYQDYIQNELMSLDDVREKVTSAYDRMRDLDIRGSFESDDEVGASFKDILSVVEQLNQDI